MTSTDLTRSSSPHPPVPVREVGTLANAGSVYTRWMADNIRTILAWGAGAAFVAVLYLPLYPSMRDSGLLGDKLDALPPDMLDGFGMDALTMGTGWGYVHQTVFAMLGMLVLLCLGISQGTRAVAGDEESGSMELTLAHATSRTGTLLARLAAVTTVVAAVTAVLLVVVLALNGPSDLQLAASKVLAEASALFLLVLLFAYLAIAVGALTGRRGLTLGVTSAVALLMWFAHTMGDKVAGWLPKLSPFEWAYGNSPLRDGADPAGLAMLALSCVVLAVAAVVGFNRRDLRT